MRTTVLLLAGLLALSSGQSRAAAGQLLINDVVVVSAEHTDPLENAAVLIADGRIRAIVTGPHTLTADETIDGRGRYLIPGLIDSHVHLGGNAGLRGDRAGRALLDAFHTREPLSYLAFGFTTLVDVSSSQAFADEWNGLPLRPDLRFCIGVPFANGYGMAFEPETVRFNTPYFLYDPAQADVIPAERRPEDHTPAAVIDKVRRTDAICVKSYYEEGFGGLFDFPVPTVELIRELAQEAHDAGLVVLLHANSLAAQQFAVAANVDIVAHGAWHWDQWNRERQVVAPVAAVLDAVLRQGVATQVTAQVIYGERDLLAGGFLDDPRLGRIVPGPLLDWYTSDDGGWFRDELVRNLADNAPAVEAFLGHPPGGDVTETSSAAIDRLHATVSWLAARHAAFVFGSDTPSSPTYTNPPGYNGLLEIRRLDALGLTNRQIFEALTSNNARRFGLDREVGTVAVGKTANLLLLGENPLDDVDAYDTIEVVFLHGRPIDRDELFLPKAP